MLHRANNTHNLRNRKMILSSEKSVSSLTAETELVLRVAFFKQTK